jgi:hypothetical protein
LGGAVAGGNFTPSILVDMSGFTCISPPLVQFHLASQELRIGDIADKDKHAIGAETLVFAPS